MSVFLPMVRRRLSAMLGAAVEIADLNVSPLRGEALARGVRVGDSHKPLLTIDAIRFKISIREAIRKRFVVESLTLDRPVIDLSQSSEGLWNLPTGSQASGSVEDRDDAGPSFDANHVFMVDGAFGLSMFVAGVQTQINVHGVMAELKREGERLRLTLLGAKGAVNGQPLGELRIAAEVGPIANLASFKQAAATAQVELGSLMKLNLGADRIGGGTMTVALESNLEMPQIVTLLAVLPPLAMLRAMDLRGRISVSTDLKFAWPVLAFGRQGHKNDV